MNFLNALQELCILTMLSVWEIVIGGQGCLPIYSQTRIRESLKLGLVYAIVGTTSNRLVENVVQFWKDAGKVLSFRVQDV